MNTIIIQLIICIVLLLILIGLVIFIRFKVRGFLQEYFDTKSLREAIDNSKIKEQETKKTIYSMEPVYLRFIKEDFPGLNIEELKSCAEMNIRNVLYTIEQKDIDELENKNRKIYNYTLQKIEDLKDKKFVCDEVKFHKTVLSKYDVDDYTATMEFQTALEYYTEDNKNKRIKKQTRFKTQFIHVINEDAYDWKFVKTLGINCCNCGAPIKNIKKKNCEYCNSKIVVPQSGVEYVNRKWFLNNLKEY